MRGVYKRYNKLWIHFVTPDGRRIHKSTGLPVGQERKAEAALNKIKSRLKEGLDYSDIHFGPQTVGSYAKGWTARRLERGISSAKINSYQLEHALAVIGTMNISEVRPIHVRELIQQLRYGATRRRGTGPLAPRTIRHVYATLHTMFEDAVAEEIIDTNPCKIRQHDLPKKIDKDPNWRFNAVFSREEMQLLISDVRIPPPRRMHYAMMFLTGLRFGEISALVWSDYETESQPLGRIKVARAYDSNNRRTKSVKTETPRAVPVHPVLAQMLGDWRKSGWKNAIGRAPQGDDLILPAFRQNNWTNQHKDESLIQLRADLDMLGLPHRRQHDMRRTFITLARADGARHDLLEMITHGKRGDIINQYTSMPWEPLCLEVMKLQVAVTATTAATPFKSAAKEDALINKSEAASVEAVEEINYNAIGSDLTAPQATFTAQPWAQLPPQNSPTTEEVLQVVLQVVEKINNIKQLPGWGTRTRT